MYCTPPSPNSSSISPCASSTLYSRNSRNSAHDTTRLHRTAATATDRPRRAPLAKLAGPGGSSTAAAASHHQRLTSSLLGANSRRLRIPSSTTSSVLSTDHLQNSTSYLLDLQQQQQHPTTTQSHSSSPSTPETPPRTESITLSLAQTQGHHHHHSDSGSERTMTESPEDQQPPAMERHPMYGNLRVAPGPPAAGALQDSTPVHDGKGNGGGPSSGQQQQQQHYYNAPRTAEVNELRPSTSGSSSGRTKQQQQQSNHSEDDQHASHAGPARTGRRAYASGSTPPPAKGKGPTGGPGSSALEHIPRAFVLQRLHELAPTFLSNPRTSDVRIVVPARQRPGSPDSRRTSETGPKTPESAASPIDAQPIAQAAAAVPARSYRLHRDYLVPQSSLFRIVLTGGLRPGAPELKGCRLLPFTSLHGPRPVYVPLPDPASFDVLVQWMYYGSVEAIENALTSGQVSWRGLVANIQYLGMDDRTKRVVGGWWRRWVRTEERERGSAPRKVVVGEDESESEAEHDDHDHDDHDHEDDTSTTNGARSDTSGSIKGNSNINSGHVDPSHAWHAPGHGQIQDGASAAAQAQHLDPVTEEMSARLGGL